MYKRIIIEETNILLKSDNKIAFFFAENSIRSSREELKNYIRKNQLFFASLSPIDVEYDAPEIVKRMAYAGKIADTGPFSSVAGAIADISTETMSPFSKKICLAENGGDISIKKGEANILVYAGNSPLSKKIAFRVKGEIGVCTSGNFGHSISFGNADAVTVFSRNATISDAVATAIANLVKEDDLEKSIQLALEKAETIKEIYGCTIIAKNLFGRVGRIPEILKIEGLKEY